jgi:hypothetical protein
VAPGDLRMIRGQFSPWQGLHERGYLRHDLRTASNPDPLGAWGWVAGYAYTLSDRVSSKRSRAA